MSAPNHMKVVHLRPAPPDQEFYERLLASMKAKDQKRVEKKYGKTKVDKNNRA